MASPSGYFQCGMICDDGHISNCLGGFKVNVRSNS